MKPIGYYLIAILTFITLSGTAQVTAQTNDTLFYFNGREIKNMRLIISERDFLKVENDSLKSRCYLYKKALTTQDLIISMQDTIINNKEQQIKELELIPKNVVKINHTKWYVFAGIIISSVATGIITGMILK